jgi:hypothetical protein
LRNVADKSVRPRAFTIHDAEGFHVSGILATRGHEPTPATRSEAPAAAPATKPIPAAQPAAAPRSLEEPQAQPIQLTLSPSSNSSHQATATYTVPQGKRLVIEYYSAQLTQFPIGGSGWVSLSTTVGGRSGTYKVVPPIGSTVPYNQLTRIYADPGTFVRVAVVQSSGGSCGASVVLSGQLLNVA